MEIVYLKEKRVLKLSSAIHNSKLFKALYKKEKFLPNPSIIVINKLNKLAKTSKKSIIIEQRKNIITNKVILYYYVDGILIAISK